MEQKEIFTSALTFPRHRTGYLHKWVLTPRIAESTNPRTLYIIAVRKIHPDGMENSALYEILFATGMTAVINNAC